MVIVGIFLGIFAALAAGAGLALIVMIHLRKKKRGEDILNNFILLQYGLFIINLTNRDLLFDF